MDESKTRDGLALLLVLAVLVIPLCHATVPDRLWDMSFMAVSFFFAANRSKPITPEPPQQPTPTAKVE